MPAQNDADNDRVILTDKRSCTERPMSYLYSLAGIRDKTCLGGGMHNAIATKKRLSMLSYMQLLHRQTNCQSLIFLILHRILSRLMLDKDAFLLTFILAISKFQSARLNLFISVVLSWSRSGHFCFIL